MEKGSVVSEAAPVDAAPEPPPDALTTDPEPRLPVMTVVVVPVTVEPAAAARGNGELAVTVTAVDEIVAKGCGVMTTDGVVAALSVVADDELVVIVFAAADGEGAAVAVEPLDSGGDVAAPPLPEVDELEPELEPELETLEVDVDAPDAPAADAVVAAAFEVLPSPLESESA